MNIQQSQRSHAIAMLKHRYDITVSESGYRELCSRLVNGESFIINRIDENCTIHLMAIEHTLVPVIFDASTQQITTAIKRSNVRWFQNKVLNAVWGKVQCNCQFDESRNH